MLRLRYCRQHFNLAPHLNLLQQELRRPVGPQGGQVISVERSQQRGPGQPRPHRFPPSVAHVVPTAAGRDRDGWRSQGNVNVLLTCPDDQTHSDGAVKWTSFHCNKYRCLCRMNVSLSDFGRIPSELRKSAPDTTPITTFPPKPPPLKSPQPPFSPQEGGT